MTLTNFVKVTWSYDDNNTMTIHPYRKNLDWSFDCFVYSDNMVTINSQLRYFKDLVSNHVPVFTIRVLSRTPYSIVIIYQSPSLYK